MNAFCDMSLDRQFFLAAVIFYAITALWGVRFWKNGFRGNLFPWAIWPISALILHSKAMLLRGFSIESCPIHNLFEAGMFISWLLSLGAVITLFIHRVRFIAILLEPLLCVFGIFILLPFFDQTKVNSLPEWVPIHAGIIFVAYGAWGIASIISIMYLIQHRNLKQKKLVALDDLLPPIKRMESSICLLMVVTFLLFSIGLAVGCSGYYFEREVILDFDIKIVWAAGVWGFLFYFFLKIQSLQLYGRRLAVGTLCGFIFILLTFWISTFYSSSHGALWKYDLQKKPTPILVVLLPEFERIESMDSKILEL